MRWKRKSDTREELALEGVSFPSTVGEGVSTFTLVSSGFEENRLRSHGYADRSRRSETRRQIIRLQLLDCVFGSDARAVDFAQHAPRAAEQNCLTDALLVAVGPHLADGLPGFFPFTTI